MTPDEYITEHLGDSPQYTLARGKLAMLIENYPGEIPDLPDEDPEVEAMRDKFNDWLDGRIANLKAPANWIDITAEFVLEQLKERENWAEVIE